MSAKTSVEMSAEVPEPLEICLEELFHAEEEDERYVRCVALLGGEPGLTLDREGAVQWMVESPEAYGLWVSQDGELVLLRGEGADPVRVERGGRAVDAPIGKPVILKDQDELIVNGRRLRLHVHGETEAIHEPERLSGTALGRLVRAAAAAATLALGAAAATTAAAQGAIGPIAVDRHDVIEVRTRPPSMPAPKPMDCAISSQKIIGGKLYIHATCPRRRGLRVGQYGQLIDPKTKKPLKDGRVTIKKVAGKKVVAEAKQRKTRASSKILRFWVH